MNPELKKQLERIFFGKIPRTVYLYDDEVLEEAFKRQGITYKYNGKFPNILNLNYTKFIQDIVALGGGPPKKLAKVPIEEMQRDMGVMMRSTYYEFINDPTKDLFEKLFITVFYNDVLVMFGKIYRVAIIDNLEPFTKELYENSGYFLKLIEQENIEFLKWHQQRTQNADSEFVLSPIWQHDILKLEQLSEALYNNGFIDSPFFFNQVFNERITGKCNWLKPRTTLIYLLWLTIDGGEQVQSHTLQLVCSRFLINGKVTAMKIAQSTNIEPFMGKPANKLTGNYKIIHSIWERIFQ